VLTDPTNSSYLPGLAGFRVYCGNWGLTDDYSPKRAVLTRLGSSAANLGGYGKGGRYRGATKPGAASWRVTGLAAGYYDVQATWSTDPDRATNARYRVLVDGTLVGTSAVNQQVAPAGPTFGGVSFQTIARVRVPDGGTIELDLSGPADGYVIADAARFAGDTAVIVDDLESGYAETGSGWISFRGKDEHSPGPDAAAEALLTSTAAGLREQVDKKVFDYLLVDSVYTSDRLNRLGRDSVLYEGPRYRVVRMSPGVRSAITSLINDVFPEAGSE
jgi:hypothetical protein